MTSIRNFSGYSRLDIFKLIGTDLDTIDSLLRKEGSFDFRNIELLSELLVEFSRNMEEKDRRMTVEKAIFLLELVNKEGKTFSFERQIKLNKFKSLL